MPGTALRPAILSRMRWRAILVVGLLPMALRAAPRAALAGDDLAARALARAQEALLDPDRGVRYAAVVALGKGGAAPEVVARGLADGERCVRYEAAWWLRRAGPAALPTVEKALADPSPTVRSAAAWSLSSFGPAAVLLLRKALADADPETRVEAVAATRRLGKDAATPLLEAIRALATSVRATKEPEVDDEADDATARAAKAEAAARRDLLGELDATIAVLDPPPPAPEPPQEPKVPADTPPPKDDGDEEAPKRPDDPALAETSPPTPALDRIDAVLALGSKPGDVAALEAALADPERDVRLAAAIALDRTPGEVAPAVVAALVGALDDRNPRVRRAALRALGRHRAAPERVAAVLDDPSLPTSTAAREALAATGATTAKAVAESMRRGGYAALHHGVLLFERFGAAGAPAVPVLAAMLADPDPNVREIAARCLFAIGPAAAPAAPPLLVALSDPRLCVVAHAALALGRVGLSEPLLAATVAPSARVRAYAWWAVAWALGTARGVDQVAYEARLPVLDVGAAGPFPTAEEVRKALAPPPPHQDDAEAEPDAAAQARAAAERVALLRRAIHAKDPAVAVPAAAALAETEVDVVEAERVMELVLPEGVREGSPVDFDTLRALVGTSEVPACVVYAARMRATSDPRSSIYGNFHRMTRADSLPFLAWFDRVEEPEVLEHVGEMWQPEDRSLRYVREPWAWGTQPPPGPDVGDAARTMLRRFLDEPQWGMGVGLWLVRELEPRADDATLLIACARKEAEEPHSSSHTEEAEAWALLGALGRLTDEASLAYLRGVAGGHDTTAAVATAAIARRGGLVGVLALRALLERSRDDEDALTLLLAVAPRVGARALVARWVGDEDLLARHALRYGCTSLVENAYRLGVRVPPEAFLGVEAELVARLASPERLAAAAVSVPGLRTRRVAARLLDLLEAHKTLPRLLEEEEGEDWGDEQLTETLALLLEAEPARTTALLRRWAAPTRTAEAGKVARRTLLRMRDAESVPMLLAWQRSLEGDDHIYADLDAVARLRTPEVVAFLRAWLDDPKTPEGDRDDVLVALAKALGWPDDVPLDLEDEADDAGDVADERRAEVIEALRRGDLAPLRAAYRHPERLPGPVETPVWKRVGRAAAAGDREARGAFWSAMRAARYRWIHYEFEPWLQTLGRDPATLPHWTEDLDSNCCRISDGLAHDAFEGNYGLPHLYDRHRHGVGGPLSDFVADWMDAAAGDWVWSPALDRFMPAPE